MTDQDAEASQRVTRFVHEHWKVLAAAAWRGFLQYGHGLVLLDWRSIEAWEQGAAFRSSPPYITQASLAALELLIDSYDPEKSVFVGVTSDTVAALPNAQRSLEPPREVRTLRAGESFHAWLFAYEPAPPVAHSETSH